MHEFTTDPIEAEVSTALTGYKLALIRTGYKGVWHRLLCWTGDKEAIARSASLERAEQHAQQVVGKTPEHRLALERIVRKQPDHVAEKDRFLELLNGSIVP